MLDINYIRKYPEAVRENLKKRNDPKWIQLLDSFLKKDEEWRKLKPECDKLRHERNEVSLRINQAKKEGKPVEELFEMAKEIQKRIAELEEKEKSLSSKVRAILFQIPNLLHESVHFGKSAEEKKVIATYGEPKKLEFAKPHVELIERHGLADFERAGKISGSRWYFLKGELAILELALARYGIDFMRKKGYSFIIPPYMINRKAYEGVTSLAAFEEMLYKIENEDLYPIATAEHSGTAQFMNEVLSQEELPIKLVAWSPCFRKEAGTHGIEEKGIFRVHQFHKVEQLIICRPEESWHFHEELLNNAVEFWKTLEVPFRAVLLCSADTGIVMSKTYDLEAWFPSKKEYKEVVSCSNACDYQARRLEIKYQHGSERHYVHTLNSTLVAVGRAIAAIIENHQQEDGTIKLPKALHKYLGFKELPAKKRVKRSAKS